ncbi:MAG: PDZ domain-containing protein, partial [Phycisphaerales bacterium]
VLIVCAAAMGQKRPRSGAVPTLARLAPADTGLFVEFQRPDRVQEQLRNLNAWHLFELFIQGGSPSGETSAPVDWGEVVSANLGVSPDTAFETLFADQAALAAPNWEHVHEGVILLRLRDPAVLEEIVGPEKVPETIRRRKKITVYQTKRGLWVATDGRFAILSLRGESSPFSGKAIGLLEGTNRQSLLAVRTYAGQVRQLEPGRAGHLYFAGPPTSPAEPPGVTRSDLWPACQWGVIGVYLRQQRVDLVVRGRLAQARGQAYRPQVDMDRLMRLPQTTLLAWGTSVDLPEAHHHLVRNPSSTLETVLASLLKVLPEADELEASLLSKLGPQIVIVWDQGADRDRAVPQLAVLVESGDATAAAAALGGVMEAVLAKLSPSADESNPGAGRLVHIEHLGTTMFQIPFETMFAAAPAGSLLGRLRGSVQPCFAPLGGWLAIALNPRQLQRIIDADRGLIPRLGDVPELGLATRQRARSVVLGLAQPALCAQVIDRWLATLASDEDSLWRTVLGDDVRSSRSRRRALGIGMRVTQKPGRVTVARVYSGAPADGHLQPGDEILGVNGRLLSLSSPNADLRRMIQSAEQNETVALRVLRDSEYVDVEITPRPAEPKPGQGGAVEALGQLARLGQALRYCTFTVFASRPDQYVARVTLGFQAPAPTSRPASDPVETAAKDPQE